MNEIIYLLTENVFLPVKYSETDFLIDYSSLHYTIYEQPNQIRFDRLWSYWRKRC